jgi:hypothetical protein
VALLLLLLLLNVLLEVLQHCVWQRLLLRARA